MQVLKKLIYLLFCSFPGNYCGICSTKTWDMRSGASNKERSSVWGQNGQHLTSSDMASIFWSLAMSWFKLPRRSWISPAWCRTFSWYILMRKEWEYGLNNLWCCYFYPQFLPLPVSPQRTSFIFFHSHGPIPEPTQKVLICKILLMLFLLLGLSNYP